MIKDLNAIYDGGDGDKKPAPSASPAKRNLDDVDAYSNRGASAISSGRVENLDIAPYIDYMPGGVYTTRKPVDFIRGENQGVGEQLGKRIADLIPNITGGLLQFFGAAGALATEWGKDNKDYSNWATEAAESMHNFGGWGDVYRENNDVWAPSDPGWWIDNIGSVAESAIPFAIGGAGVAGVLGKAAEGITDIANLGANGARIMKAAAHLGTSAYMSYAEGAQAGAEVFKNVYANQYQKQLDKGLSPDEADKQAKLIASSSAATTVQLNTILGTALNMSSVAPFFRKAEDVAGGIIEKQMKRLAGESTADWSKRIAAMSADQYAAKLIEHHGLGSYMKEAGQESFEEWMNQFTQKTGEQEGEEGRTHGFFEQFKLLENWFSRTTGADDALAAALGGFGGIANTVAVSHIPSRYTTQYAEGQRQKVDSSGNLIFDEQNKPVYQKHFVSPHNLDKWGTLQSFNNLRDSVAADAAQYADREQKYMTAASLGDALGLDKAAQEMFNPLLYQSVRGGMTEPWIQSFQAIADMTPEAAKSAGWADDYKERAGKAVQQLKTAAQEYDKLKTQYGIQWESNTGARQVLDMMMGKKIDLMNWDSIIKEHEGLLAKNREEESKQAKLKDPIAYDQNVDTYNRQWKVSEATLRNLQVDLNTLKAAADSDHYDQEGVQELINKYRAKGIDDSDMPGAVRDLVQKLQKTADYTSKKLQSAQDSLLASSGYMQWQEKNPNGAFEEFMQSVQKGYELNRHNLFHEQNIAQSKAEYDIAASNYADITGEKNLGRFIRKANDWQEKLTKAAIEEDNRKVAEIAEKAKDRATLDRAQRIEMNKVAERYAAMRDEQLTKAAEVQAKLEAVQKEKEGVKLYKDPLRYAGLRRQEKELQNELRRLKAQATHLDSLHVMNSVNTDSAEVTEEEESDESNMADDTATAEPEQTSPDIDVPAGEQIEEATGLETNPELADTEDSLDFFNALMDGETEPTPEAVTGELASDPAVSYATMLAKVSPAIRQVMHGIVVGLNSNLFGFSYDLLNTNIANGEISQEEAVKLLQSLKEYMSLSETVIEPVTAPVIVPVEVQMDTTETDMTDSPVIALTDEDTVSGEETVRHIGKKTLSALTIANTTFENVRDAKDSKGNYRKEVDKDNINPEYNQKLLTNGYGAGDGIRFVVDTEYDGPKSRYNDPESDEYGNPSVDRERFSDYTDDKAKVRIDDRSIGQVPIKIVDRDGSKIGYVKTMGFINAKFPNTIDYRNIVAVTTDNAGNEINNLAIQNEKLMTLRRSIVTQFNNGNLAMDGNIIKFGPGSLILNTENNNQNSHLRPGFARSTKEENSLLPDQNIKLGIVDKSEGSEGVIHTAKEFPFPGQKAWDNINLPNGSIVALLPMANGTHQYTRLIGKRLVEDKDTAKTAVKSVSRVIELYLKNGTVPEAEEEIAILLRKTGFNVGTLNGLRAFINQYFTYTQSFKYADTIAGSKGKEDFLFAIANPVANQNKGEIKLGWRASGRNVVSAQLKNGTLNQEFLDVLEEGFRTRARAVVYTDTSLGLRGINESNALPFRDALYTDSGWRHKEFPSYNEYVKSFSKTIVYGRNKLSDGRYNYAANPVVEFSQVDPQQFPVMQVEQKTEEEDKASVSNNNKPVSQPILSTIKDSLNNIPVLRTGTGPQYYIPDELAHQIYANDKANNPIFGLHDQPYERMVARGGWSISEMDKILPDWKEILVNIQTQAKKQQVLEKPVLPVVDQSSTDFLSSLMNDSYPEMIQSVSIGTAPDNSRPMSAQSLEELYNFTPEALRNGRTPQEVYDQLAHSGISFLSEGYNPFSRCV